MRRGNRPIALVLLLMAVLCSPAGVCVIDGIAGTVQAAPPPHAHSCGNSMDGTALAPSEESCCTEQPTGFVSIFRFTLQKQVAAAALEFDIAPPVPIRLVSFRAAQRRTPLVLRI